MVILSDRKHTTEEKPSNSNSVINDLEYNFFNILISKTQTAQ